MFNIYIVHSEPHRSCNVSGGQSYLYLISIFIAIHQYHVGLRLTKFTLVEEKVNIYCYK